MVDAELRDAGDDRLRDDVGRVEPPTEPDLDDAGIGGRTGEGEECRCGRDLEKARADITAGVEHFFEQWREFGIRDQRTGEADTFVEADEMGARIDMRRVARRLDRRAQEGAGRSLAVGAGDMEYRRLALVRIADALKQFGDPLEAENVGTRGERP
jgi:hypothetical protein